MCVFVCVFVYACMSVSRTILAKYIDDKHYSFQHIFVYFE